VVLLQVYADEERSSVVGKFYGLRQQAEKDNDEPYMCVSDFIAPKGSGVADYVGAFACSAGHGLEKVVEEYKKAGMSVHLVQLRQRWPFLGSVTRVCCSMQAHAVIPTIQPHRACLTGMSGV